MSDLKSYWLSWYATHENGCFWLDWPWWISGFRFTDDADTICAAVRAPSEEAAKQLIVGAHDNPPPELEWRFCHERPASWSPYCDRFPKGSGKTKWQSTKPEGER
jgi:hypothetical protein